MEEVLKERLRDWLFWVYCAATATLGVCWTIVTLWDEGIIVNNSAAACHAAFSGILMSYALFVLVITVGLDRDDFNCGIRNNQENLDRGETK